MTFAFLRVFLIDSSDQAKDLFQVLDFEKGLAWPHSVTTLFRSLSDGHWQDDAVICLRMSSEGFWNPTFKDRHNLVLLSTCRFMYLSLFCGKFLMELLDFLF